MGVEIQCGGRCVVLDVRSDEKIKLGLRTGLSRQDIRWSELCSDNVGMDLFSLLQGEGGGGGVGIFWWWRWDWRVEMKSRFWDGFELGREKGGEGGSAWSYHGLHVSISVRVMRLKESDVALLGRQMEITTVQMLGGG